MPANIGCTRRAMGRNSGRRSWYLPVGSGSRRAGLTVSSLMVANGAPARVLGLLDPDATLAELLADTGRGVVQLLEWADRDLADAFAGVAPAPGGPFRLNTWVDSSWGPVLAHAPAWLGARVLAPIDRAGWGLLVRAVVEHVEVGAGAEGVPAAADQDHPHVVVLLRAVERLTERHEERPVDAVLLVGAVQPDRGDAPFDLVLQDVLGVLVVRLLLHGHGRSPLDAKLNSNHTRQAASGKGGAWTLTTPASRVQH